MKIRVIWMLMACELMPGQGPVIGVDKPMPPPAWALMERALLKANSDAARAFYRKYVDDRGYLLHTPRWGTLDGPVMRSRPFTTGLCYTHSAATMT